MFGGTFAFGDAAAQFPSASQEDAAFSTQDVQFASRGVRDLGTGIVPVTISILRRAHLVQGSFASGQCDLYGSEWQFAVLVCMISSLNEDEDGVWVGEIHDGTGTMGFRYEKRAEELGAQYLKDIRSIQPPREQDENEPAEKPVQLPARFVGVPQVISGELCFLVSFLRPADFTDYLASHPMESAWMYLEHDKNEDGVKQMKVVTAVNVVPNKDPYNDEPIAIGNADMADLVGTSRLSRCIWKYLQESDSSTLVASIKSFCRSKWSAEETLAAIVELEEAGVVMFSDSAKTRIQLVEEN